MDGAGWFFPNNNIWALGFFPNTFYDTYYYDGVGGDIYANINSLANTLPSYEVGSPGYFLLLHELGHALGLKHTFDDGGTGGPTLDDLNLGDFDKDWFSIMSYSDDFNFNLINFDPATPMLLDVLGLQALYGKNETTNTGNDVYVLDETITFYYTVWDAAGTDRVDASASGKGWYIELPDTILSTIVAEPFGFALPLADLDLASPTALFGLRAKSSMRMDQLITT